MATKDHKAACTHAAIQANEAVTPSKPSPPDPYRWKWCLTVEASETATALFLNVVAIAAHAADIRSGKAQYHLPSIRFVTLPNPQRALPLSNGSTAQDCRPDVVAFDCAAFCQAPNPIAPTNRFLLGTSPFEYIRKKLPTLLQFTPAHMSANGSAVVAFEEWFSTQESCNYLDMSRFCWPEVQLTAEAKLSDLHDAILQELVYMRQQRRIQPWMRSIIGLVITTKIIGVLRADTLGVAQCIVGNMKPSSSDTKTLGPPHLKSEVGGSSKKRASKAAVYSDLDVFAAEDPAEDMVEYIHRTVRFIRLRGDHIHYSNDGTKQDITYYVHHLVHDNGSLVGRCPRIFCVSRETESQDAVRRFVGPYALKVYYADHASDCYKYDLIDQARKAQVKKVLLPTWEWRYGDALSIRGFSPDLVKEYTEKATAIVPTVVSNREEVFAQSDLKRLLVQCSGHDEFEQAFVDFAEAIASLAEEDLVHRDLSIGNVLLSQDAPCPPDFFSDAAASAEALIGTPVAFTQRPLEQRMGGLIHDMDMAGRVHHLPEKAPIDDSESNDSELLAMLIDAEQPERPAQPVGPKKGFRTGTPPFMAIGLLIDGPPHLVAHDLHSLLFVLALFFWSHPTFRSDVPFPQPVPTRSRTWPQDVLRWANPPVDFSPAELGHMKRAFFSNPRSLAETFRRTLRGDTWTANSAYLRLFWGLYAALWRRPSAGTSSWVDRLDVTTGEVVARLEASKTKNLQPADTN
ncbi:hypothetical protein B0H17DRAFT_1337395 [Mycena rosella]|uniref:Fungal-type protein kinase domain-containing protein n=1 Tax=Mycena rosella TaxID=1033263 RepID=A0AAD7CRB5_MYCRO|nr:hypothetical protein B0H17DRAFT_1337395 [Mycena rosella]